MTMNQDRKVRIGTVNVGGGLLCKVPLLLELMEEELLDVLFLQETGADVLSIPGLTPTVRFMANGRGLGVGMLLTTHLAERITETDETAEGVLSVATTKIALTTIYCPTALDFEPINSNKMIEATNRYDKALRFGSKFAGRTPHIIGGDLNETRTRADASDSRTRRHGRVVNHALADYIDIVRHFRPQATRADATYIDPRGGWSRLDYLLFKPEHNGQHPSQLVSADIREMPELRSRHRAVICTLTLRACDDADTERAASYVPRYFRVAGSNQEQKERFAGQVNSRMAVWAELAPDIVYHADIDDLAVVCDQMRLTILSAAEQELGTTTGRSTRIQRQLRRKGACRRKLQRCLRQLHNAAASDTNVVNAAHTMLAKNGWHAAEATRTSVVNMLRKAIQALRRSARSTRTRDPDTRPTAKKVAASLSAARAPTITTVTDKSGKLCTEEKQVHATLLKHFGDMISDNKARPSDPAQQQWVNPALGDLLRPFEADEVRRLICSDKCRLTSAAGLDGLTEGLLRVATAYTKSTNLLQVVTAVFNAILRNGDVPSAFKRYLVHPFYKVAGTTDIDKVRPITLIPATARILYKLLANRQQEAAERNSNLFHPSQHGFLRGRSAQDAIRLRAAAAQHAKANGTCIYSVLYDFKSAYDSVGYDVLERSLLELGYPVQYVRFTIQRLSQVTVQVQTAHGISRDSVPMQKGVRQGDPESCLFWNAVLDPLVRSLNDSSAFGFDFGDQKVAAVAFADDLSSLSSNAAGIHRIHQAVLAFCRERALTLNVDKCSLQSSPPSAPPPQSLSVGSAAIKKLPATEVPRYLGVRCAVDASSAAAEADVRSIVGRYCRQLRAEGVRMGLTEAVTLINTNLAAKLAYHAGALSGANDPSLDGQVSRAVSIAFSLGTPVPQDVLHVLAGVKLPSAIFVAAQITETMLQLNGTSPQRKALMESARHRDSPIRRASKAATEANMLLEVHGRRESMARASLAASNPSTMSPADGVQLSCNGEHVIWAPESRILFRSGHQRASPEPIRVVISAGVANLKQHQADATTREYHWSAILIDDSLLQLEAKEYDALAARSPAGLRARAQTAIIGRRSRLQARLSPEQVAIAAAVSALLTLPVNASVELILPWTRTMNATIHQQIESHTAARAFWKRADAAYVEILRKVLHTRRRAGAVTALSCSAEASESLQEWGRIAHSAVERELVAKGSLPSPALATEHASLSLVTTAGEIVRVSGAWRTCAKDSLLQVSYTSAAAKCTVISALKLTLTDIGRIRNACWTMPVKRCRHRVLRWVTNLFLFGRNQFVDDVYGKRIATPSCDCKQHEAKSIFHYMICAERRATSDATIALLVQERADQSLGLLLRRIRELALTNPRLCLGLDIQELTRGAGSTMRLQQNILDFSCRCWPDS